MNYEVTDFTLNPLLRKLMSNYYGIAHEMPATDDDLISEYHWLSSNKEIYKIFECEKLTNSFKL